MAECDDKDISVPSISLYDIKLFFAVKCDDKDISVPPFLLNSRPIFFHETKVENKIYL